MKISELLSAIEYDDSSMEEVKSCHPKQIINDLLTIPIWAIKYKYNTVRENQRTATKYLFLDEDSWDCVENEFMSYIERMNTEHPERKLSNVEILDAEFMGKVYLPLE